VSPDDRYAVVDDFYDGLSYTLTNLVYGENAPLRAHPLRRTFEPAAQIHCRSPDLTTAERHEIVLQGGMMVRE